MWKFCSTYNLHAVRQKISNGNTGFVGFCERINNAYEVFVIHPCTIACMSSLFSKLCMILFLKSESISSIGNVPLVSLVEEKLAFYTVIHLSSVSTLVFTLFAAKVLLGNLKFANSLLALGDAGMMSALLFFMMITSFQMDFLQENFNSWEFNDGFNLTIAMCYILFCYQSLPRYLIKAKGRTWAVLFGTFVPLIFCVLTQCGMFASGNPMEMSKFESVFLYEVFKQKNEFLAFVVLLSMQARAAVSSFQTLSNSEKKVLIGQFLSTVGMIWAFIFLEVSLIIQISIFCMCGMNLIISLSLIFTKNYFTSIFVILSGLILCGYMIYENIWFSSLLILLIPFSIMAVTSKKMLKETRELSDCYSMIEFFY